MPKSFPKISVYKKWQRAVLKARRMLSAIDENEPIQGTDWARGMRRHWQTTLDNLLANEPQDKR